MTKILGLDLGTNSIGWAVIDKENKKVINTGVRIFKAGSSDIGKGENEKSNNAERREHRQARRQNYRKRLRKVKLLRTLIDNEMCPISLEELNRWKNWDKSKKTAGRVFPESKEFIEWLKMNPYELRSIAVNKMISRHEFGRILYHFIQRRGFLSSRKGNEDGAIYKGKDNMDGIDDTRKLMDTKTLGEKLYEILPKGNNSFRRILDNEGNELRIRARYTLREMYIDEFERIWQAQCKHLGLEDLRVKTWKEIILEGNSGTVRYKKKLDSLKVSYGENNLKIEENRVFACKSRSFKEYLAGKIEYNENGIHFKSNDSVLFWQRPLRSQKGLLGKCTFENKLFYDKVSGKKFQVGASPCPVSHPEFELFRAYQFINNISFGSKDIMLNEAQRLVILELINKNERNFEFAKVTSALNLTYERYNFDDKFKVPANPTHKRIRSFFTDEQWKFNSHDIWHCFYFYEDKEKLKKKLITTYGLTPENAEKASSQRLEDGYSSVSLKAIRNILPFLERGFKYSTSVILGGVKNAFGERWDRFEGYHDEIIQKVKTTLNSHKHKEFEVIIEIKKLLSDPENSYGFSSDDKAFRKLYHHSQELEKKTVVKRLPDIENLRNPIVQKCLNETRRLVNDLLEKYSSKDYYGEDFMFDKIHVELGRELRSGKKQRQEMEYRIAQNERANEEAKTRVIEYGLKPSRDNLTKYRLFEEIENKHKPASCPYTNKVIRIADLLGSKNIYQIEHIIPYSVSLDDSFMNKTLCESNFNRLKGELTPYEFYQKNSDPKLWGSGSWEEIERRAYSLLPYAKAKRFTMKKRPDNQEFISRQLNDTRYIGIKAANILKSICEDVMVMPGQMTSELRRLWGLNNIMQPVGPLALDGYKVHEVKSMPHYVILNQDGVPSEIIPQLAERPLTSINQILLPGWYDGKNSFSPEIKHQQIRLEIDTGNLPKGKYWAKLNISDPIKFKRIFLDRPDLESDHISFRGKVSDKKFSNESIKKKLDADVPDGLYWGIFKVRKTLFVEPEKGNQPKTTGNQVMLYGEVKDNIFASYIYRCETNLEPGRYWALLDLDFQAAEFVAAVNKPDQSNNKLYIDGTVDDLGLFSADCDPGYSIKTDLGSGKYYSIVSLNSIEGFHPVENPKPELKKGESIIEGNIWVNSQTGEIMFDPKKNRDDHRHHAIDAIAVALTDRSYLQKLSHYFGEYKENERGVGDRPFFDIPWPGFEKDVKQAIDNIFVSYSRNSKILSKISKTIRKSGKTYQSVGYAARGRLHREYYFGRHLNPLNQLAGGGNGVKYEIGKDGKPIYYYHIRKPVTSIQNNKHIGKIVDPGIRELILNRLRQVYHMDVSGDFKIPDNFFYDEQKNPALFLPNKRGEPVPIRRVRLREFIGKAVQLKDAKNQWVNPYNNHHVVIYQTEAGELKEDVVSFWEVIERIQQGESVYRMPEDGTKIVTTLQENEMFLIGLPEVKHDAIDLAKMDRSLLSKYLYRVQKISSMYYTFRHHLASTVTNEQEEIRVQSMRMWQDLNPTKVYISNTGKLTIL